MKKRLLVYLRENGLKRVKVAQTTGIPYPTISKWDREYNESYEREKTLEHRGYQNLVSQEFIECLMRTAGQYLDNQSRRKRIGNITSFQRWLRGEHGEQLRSYPFERSRRVITDILVAHDLYTEKISKNNYAQYKPRIKRYYPGAQLEVDGKELKVELNGTQYSFNLETCVDIATDAITSHKISDQETAEVVIEVLEEHVRLHGKPLGLLMDNSNANLSAEVEGLLKEQGIMDILAYPGKPETKGHIEGENSRIEDKIGTIRIKGRNEREIARSVLERMVRLYVEMRGQTPRCSVCNRMPLELMNYEPTQEERARAQGELHKQREKSQSHRSEERAPVPEEKEVLIRGVVERNGLEVTDTQRFRKALCSYDTQAIKKAEDDFYAYSSRENFYEPKRTGQYFVGIVRNKQIEIDQQRRRELLRQRYYIDEKWKQKRAEIERLRETREAEERRRKYPEKELVGWLVNVKKISKAINTVPDLFIAEIRKCLKIICSKQNWKNYYERMKEEIMSLTEFEPQHRMEMVVLVSRWVEETRKTGAKSVTLF